MSSVGLPSGLAVQTVIPSFGSAVLGLAVVGVPGREDTCYAGHVISISRRRGLYHGQASYNVGSLRYFAVERPRVNHGSLEYERDPKSP